MDKLSKNLTILRKAHNLTQEDLSKMVFVSRQAVSKWERGESIPDIHTLVALAQMYNVSIDDMIASEDIMSAINATKTQQLPSSNNAVEIHKKELIKQMLIWGFCLLGIYALICGILQTALFDISHEIWLIWFTLPIVPPVIFALRFKNYINKKWLMFFVDMPFISGIIFILIQNSNRDGAWISFLLIPAYYAIAVMVFAHYHKREKTTLKTTDELSAQTQNKG